MKTEVEDDRSELSCSFVTVRDEDAVFGKPDSLKYT